MAKITPKLERHVYVSGTLTTSSGGTPFYPRQAMYIKSAKATLQVAPSGSGSTVVNLIKNGDASDIVYTATFSAGDTSVSISTEATIAADTKLSVNVSSVAGGSAGTDLIFSFTYHN